MLSEALPSAGSACSRRVCKEALFQRPAYESQTRGVVLNEKHSAGASRQRVRRCPRPSVRQRLKKTASARAIHVDQRL